MIVETLLENADLVLLLISVILAAVAWIFRNRARAMEKYVEANRATRQFVDVIMISLEDLDISESERDEILQHYARMKSAVWSFCAALDNGVPPDQALDESTRKILKG